jgi:hypothetical protein
MGACLTCRRHAGERTEDGYAAADLRDAVLGPGRANGQCRQRTQGGGKRSEQPADQTTTVGIDGLTGTLEPVPGKTANFESEVIFTGDTSFQEVGTIRFGDGHRLRFASVGSGFLAPSADPARKQGAVTWRVDGGEGQFAGASGLITSNLFVDTQLGIVDHHFGVLLLP